MAGKVEAGPPGLEKSLGQVGSVNVKGLLRTVSPTVAESALDLISDGGGVVGWLGLWGPAEAWHQELASRKSLMVPNQRAPAHTCQRVCALPHLGHSWEDQEVGKRKCGPQPVPDSLEEESLLKLRGLGWAPRPQRRLRGHLGPRLRRVVAGGK